MVDGKTIIFAARSWLDVPWRHQGRSRFGVDCVGLCFCVARELGMKVQDITGYPRRSDGHQLMSHLSTSLTSIEPGCGQVGDVALFRDCGLPIHVGFLAQRKGFMTVIHAHARRRKVVEEPLEIFGKPFAIYRLKGAV